MIIATSEVPVFAWKTKALITNSVHSFISNAALDIISATGRSLGQRERARFKTTLAEASGWLNNDANAHGNLLWNNERIDPGGNPADPNDPRHTPHYWAPINFNGGPFFRWWVRALQSEALCSTVFPTESSTDPDSGTLETVNLPDTFESNFKEQSRNPYGVSAKKIYQYAGLMAHLIQDNGAPAHMANIRHGWWEGVEWWHDRTATHLGGAGRDYPNIDKALAMIINSTTPGNDINWTDIAFKKFIEEDATFGKPVSNDHQKNLIEKYLENGIKSNKDFAMPSLDLNQVDIWIARRSLKEDLNERATLLAGENEQSNCIGTFDPNGAGKYFWNPFGRDRLNRADLLGDKGPQFFAGSQALGLFVQGQWISDSTNKLSLDWHKLNDGTTLWVPNRKYTGKAFDTNWGAHGGGLAYPNRDFPIDTIADIEKDGIEWKGPSGLDARGRIFPGDLYVIHPAQDYRSSPQPVPGISQIQGWRDERSWESVDINPMVYPNQTSNPAEDNSLGAQLLDRSAAWNAVFYEQFSQALPPMITRFAVVPRRRDIIVMDLSKDPIPWFSGLLGGYLRLGFDTNREEDHRLEAYAIPADQFRDVSNWRRFITTSPTTLSESDLTVWDNYPTASGGPGDTQTPTGTNTLLNARPKSGGQFTDFCYQKLIAFPIKLFKEKQILSILNLKKEANPGAFQIDVPPGALTPNGSEDRLPMGYTNTFTWTGEVGDPVALDPENETPNPYKTEAFENKKILPSGYYFIYFRVYKKAFPEAFARNQFKITNTTKLVFECNDWINKHWDDQYVKESQYNFVHGIRLPDFILPDELFPIRVDSERPVVR